MPIAIGTKLERSAALLALVFCLVMAPAFAQTKRTCADIEAFMRTANSKITGRLRVVMDNGIMQHPVFSHTSDESYSPDHFRDTWKAAVAGYELARILQ